MPLHWGEVGILLHQQQIAEHTAQKQLSLLSFSLMCTGALPS